MGTLAATSGTVDVRPWPDDGRTVMLVLRDHRMTPTTGDVERWVDEIARRGDVDVVRTGALFPAAATTFAASGFVPIDHLALLERPVDRPARRKRRVRQSRAERRLETARDRVRDRPQAGPLVLKPLRPRRYPDALAIDRLGFAPPWANDERSLRDTIAATPRHRTRAATFGGTILGFAITGLAGPAGYLQRLAVDPEYRRHGIASRLVDDALTWLGRNGATTALVNTRVDNDAALQLYRRFDFHRSPDDLVVLERHIEPR